MRYYLRLVLSLSLILTMAAIVLARPRPAAAAGVVGNGTAASCTEAAFITALGGGGLVTFNCGAVPVTLAIASRKTIATTTTVDGGNLVTLSGSNGIFFVPAAKTLTLQNLTISDGTSNQGGVDNQGSLTLQNVSFKNNRRGLNNQWGGVVSIQGGLFQNNKPSGAIFNQASTITINGSSFVSNTATLGGAIDSESGSQLTITNAVFNNNTATGTFGGAIYNGTNGTVLITASQSYQQ